MFFPSLKLLITSLHQKGCSPGKFVAKFLRFYRMTYRTTQRGSLLTFCSCLVPPATVNWHSHPNYCLKQVEAFTLQSAARECWVGNCLWKETSCTLWFSWFKWTHMNAPSVLTSKSLFSSSTGTKCSHIGISATTRFCLGWLFPIFSTSQFQMCFALPRMCSLFPGSFRYHDIQPNTIVGRNTSPERTGSSTHPFW